MICSWLGGWLISAVDLIDCVCFSLFLGFLVLVIVLVVSYCLGGIPYGIPESSSVTKSKLNTTSFAAKSFNNIKRGNNSNNTRGEFEALAKLPTCTRDANKELGLHNQLMKLMQFPMSLDDCYESVRSALLTKGPLPKVKDALYVKTVTYDWIIDSGANQHLTISTIGMSNVLDISNLNITVGHPNCTLATISHFGNFKLTNNVMLYDVLVVPGY
ncbi:hypothetical protein Tco_0560862 [Tanacetum coccineum]